jgi:hypothetical protein
MLAIESIPFEKLLHGTKAASNRRRPWWSLFFSDDFAPLYSNFYSDGPARTTFVAFSTNTNRELVRQLIKMDSKSTAKAIE